MRQVHQEIMEAAKTPAATILIMGESGCGKGVAAQRIHELSHGNKAPFVQVDCTTIPRELWESELFGHERGAFTGAHKSKAGLFEVAREGTLFLDEIGEIDPMLQSKLLRVLEERVFKRVGGTAPIEFRGRCLAATNRPLLKQVEQGKFREDLFFRLNMFEVHLPPLRQCQEDILPLTRYFVERFNRQYNKSVAQLSAEALHAFQTYRFPGNVRELRNIVERSIIGSRGRVLNSDLILRLT